VRVRHKRGARLPILYSEECRYALRLEQWRQEVWGGVSPRGLTKLQKIISLGAHPPGGLIRDSRPDRD